MALSQIDEEHYSDRSGMSRPYTTPLTKDCRGGSRYVGGFMVFSFLTLWFYGFVFMVVWFHGFRVLWFYGFMALWLHGFNNLSNTYFMFLIDVDLISMMSDILFIGFSSFVGARLFQFWSNM